MIIVSKKYHLFLAAFFLITAYMTISLSPIFLGGAFYKGGYFGLVGVTVLYLAAYLIVSGSNYIVRDHICIPSVLFLCSFGYFVYAGTLDHYLQVVTQAKFIYVESLAPTYNYICFSLLSWIAAYVVGQVISKDKLLCQCMMIKDTVSPKTSTLAWDKKMFFLTILFWGTLGIIAFLVFFLHYVGGFPVLQGTSPNASPELRALIIGRAHNITVVAFNAATMAIMFGGVYLVIYKKNKFVITLLFVTSIVLFLLWGARIYIALPFMVVFMLFIHKGKYSLKATLGVLAIIMLVGSVYGLVRNLQFYRSHGLEMSEETIVEKLADLHIAPEFRDTLGVISHLDELQSLYDPDSYLKGIYLTALPKKILTLIGVDKDMLFSEDGIGAGWLIAKVTRESAWTAVRPGIIGQALMAFGLKGVIAIFFFYGLLFSQLDKLSKQYSYDSPWLVLIYILTVVFSFSIIGTTHGTFSKFWYFIYGYLITIALASKKTRQTIKA